MRQARQRRQELRQARSERQREVVSYYQQGSSYGKPTALLLYELLRQQRLEGTHPLW